jgi:hypothetical protein
MSSFLIRLIASLNLSPLPRIGTNLEDRSAATTIFNIFLGIAGAVALLIITISGLRFSISRGDPGTISKAKNSIIYAVIGLVVIAFAAVLVNFVFSRV